MIPNDRTVSFLETFSLWDIYKNINFIFIMSSYSKNKKSKYCIIGRFLKTQAFFDDKSHDKP
jgi:hypothetical protein